MQLCSEYGKMEQIQQIQCNPILVEWIIEKNMNAYDVLQP